MTLHDLTTKRCCLLGVCGFMRTSDIEPIDLDEPVSTTFSDKIILKAMSPKEKHLGLRIQKEITIRQNDDHLFLSGGGHTVVLESPYPSSASTFASCLPHVSINYLLRDIRDCHRPVYAQRIFNHIKSVMSLLLTTSRSERLRVRALRSIRALMAGASVDDVMTHGNWSIQACLPLSIVCL
jgi:hypothetical protein